MQHSEILYKFAPSLIHQTWGQHDKFCKEKMTKFNQFAAVCKEIANDLHTIVEVREYSEYGWGQVAFMTDHFGGIYVCLHYDMETGKVTNWYGMKMAKELSHNYSELYNLVKHEMKKMLKDRDLKEIGELVNAEY